MEEQMKGMHNKICSDKGFCFCRAIAAALIIVLVWTAPSWANIVITVLAALIILGSSTNRCCCRKNKK